MTEDTAQKHSNKNGKKEGVSGSSFFTWFMVIALLGVWTSVAVVWFDLVDYEEFLGKLGDYDADGDGDFDVDDAKVLLGLKERTVTKKVSEDFETDSIASEISDADLEDAINAIEDSLSPDNDVFDIEDALDDHETQDDVSEFSLEDAVEPNVHKSIHSEPEVEDEKEEEPEIEEEVDVAEEPAVEEQAFDEVTEQVLEQEPAAAAGDDVEEAPLEEEDEEEPEPVYEQEIEETETEFLNAPETEIEEAEEVEYAAEPLTVEAEETPAPVAEEEPEVELATEEQEPEDENLEAEVPEQQEESETHAESVGNENLPSEDGHVSYDEVDEISPETEVEEEEAAELSDDPDQDEETVPEETEESAPEASDTPDEDTLEAAEDIVEDDNEEEVNDVPLANEPSEPAENPVVDDRPSEKVEEQNTAASEGQHEEHAGGESLSQDKKEKAKKKKPKLVNKFDKTIKAELDAAEKLRKKGKVDDALKAFELLVTKYPQSPRARYGKAQCEDDLAEKMRSNEILLRAIGSYEEVAGLPNVPTDLVKIALGRRANRQQFLGRMRGSILTLQKLVQLYPEDISLRNELGVGYLLLGDNQKAKQVYEEVLSLDPNNGFAKVHYGFILKAENKIVESIPYLKEGLLSGEPGTDDGRFYFHLGDALQRTGDKEAYTWYEAGHKRGHFASVWQRSLYNVNGLKAQAWWTAKETGYTDLVRVLEANWKIVRDEGLAVMDKTKGLFVPEDENLREKGDWSQYTLWQQGRMNEKSCKAAPKTCALLERFPESTGCRRGQIKYSVMQPGTHVWPHTGPTNCRLRMHLGLVIPKQGCKIRCANDTRSWEEGKVLIFDDSFEHEVWQEADSYRLIFIVDVWHPDLTQHQRRTLPAI